MSLEKHLATYQREKDRLLAEGEQGRFALVGPDAVVSVWDTHRDAAQVGYEKFGLQEFLIQRIELVTPVQIITRLLVPNAVPDATTGERRTAS